MNRQRAEARGHWGEKRAAWWLRLQGWRIIGERVKAPGGEIDLIARRRGIVAFVEVKTRATQAELDLSIDEYRLGRVAAAASALAPRYVRDGEDMRIDVILIAPRAWPRHFVNAWIGST
jgi:putative endonuclease